MKCKQLKCSLNSAEFDFFFSLCDDGFRLLQVLISENLGFFLLVAKVMNSSDGHWIQLIL